MNEKLKLIIYGFINKNKFWKGKNVWLILLKGRMIKLFIFSYVCYCL